MTDDLSVIGKTENHDSIPERIKRWAAMPEGPERTRVFKRIRDCVRHKMLEEAGLLKRQN